MTRFSSKSDARVMSSSHKVVSDPPNLPGVGHERTTRLKNRLAAVMSRCLCMRMSSSIPCAARLAMHDDRVGKAVAAKERFRLLRLANLRDHLANVAIPTRQQLASRESIREVSSRALVSCLLLHARFPSWFDSPALESTFFNFPPTPSMRGERALTVQAEPCPETPSTRRRCRAR